MHRSIAEGEEVCDAYIDIAHPRAERQRRLHQKYQFVCCCERCTADAEELDRQADHPQLAQLNELSKEAGRALETDESLAIGLWMRVLSAAEHCGLLFPHRLLFETNIALSALVADEAYSRSALPPPEAGDRSEHMRRHGRSSCVPCLRMRALCRSKRPLHGVPLNRPVPPRPCGGAGLFQTSRIVGRSRVGMQPHCAVRRFASPSRSSRPTIRCKTGPFVAFGFAFIVGCVWRGILCSK